MLAPRPNPSDPTMLVFLAPLGDGACPLIYFKDYGSYVRWMLDTPSRSNGMQLHVATEDIKWNDLAAVYSEVTGKKSVYNRSRWTNTST